MRLLTWNMAAGFGYEARKHDRAWRWLAYADPDVALLQETQPPEWAIAHWPALQHSPTYARSPWGAAILSKTVPLDTVEPSTPWLRKLRGKVQIARLAGAHPLWLASIHSNAYPLKPEELDGMPLEKVRRCHDEKIWQVEVLAAELAELFVGHRFVAGGDLNSALLFDKNNRYDNNARLWANLAADGFHDLRQRFQPLEQRTYFAPGRGPYQLDHLFADAVTCGEALAWTVRAEPAESGLVSDHAPVEVELGALS
jgi:endonuclease/exonuclease/phosphatase family metal-dependent hydrolase